MLLWAISDRGIPRSYRAIQGFGVHTIRFVDADGDSRFVKLHWNPVAGTQSLVWNEAAKLAGVDADSHRRDMWESIESGLHPEWELDVQVFTEADAAGWSAYQDTQNTRLGGPNFAEIPINAPVAPVFNNQRDGLHRATINRGRVAYAPTSLAGGCPFQAGRAGFVPARARSARGPQWPGLGERQARTLRPALRADEALLPQPDQGRAGPYRRFVPLGSASSCRECRRLS